MEYHDSPRLWRDHLNRALIEDHSQWDWTGLSVPDSEISAEIIAKESGVWVGCGLFRAAEHVASEMRGGLEIEALFPDGAFVPSGAVLGRWKGSSRTILKLERLVLNLASYACGIASQTRKLVQIVEKSSLDPKPRISATRKTLPFYQDIALYALMMGGGRPHRLGLSGGVLIKENHIDSGGGIQRVVQQSRELAPHTLRIEVEVRDEKELDEAIEAKVDVVMLDNFSPDRIRKVIDRIPDSVMVEVSGGVREETLPSFLIPGVDIISVGSLTHSVRAMDLSLLIKS